MLSKQLTSKLKEEQERENQQNPSHLNVAQCDRLIRTVSCKVIINHKLEAIILTKNYLKNRTAFVILTVPLNSLINIVFFKLVL